MGNRIFQPLSILALAAASLFAMPLHAQESAAPEAESAGRSDAKPLHEMSNEELVAHLKTLAKSINRGMDVLERELAKLSLEPRRVEEIRAEMETLLSDLKAGKLQNIPAGLEAYLKDNPQDLAEALGKSSEEASALTLDAEAMAKALRSSTEGVSKLLEVDGVMQEVLERQVELERALEETMRNQKELADSTNEDIAKVLDAAYELSSRSG